MRDPFEGAALPAASKQEQPPDALPVSRLDARQIPLAHRFDAWHEGCAPLFDTTCLGDPGRFDVGAICYLVDRLMFTRVHFERMHFSRGTPQLSSGESDCITVQHYRRGSVTGRLDDGTPLCMAPDRISIHDYAHAYTGVGETTESFGVIIPRHLLTEHDRIYRHSPMFSWSLDSPRGRLLTSALAAIWRELPLATQSDSAAIASGWSMACWPRSRRQTTIVPVPCHFDSRHKLDSECPQHQFRHDAGSAGSSPTHPEEIGITLLTDAVDLAVRGDDLRFDQVVRGQTEQPGRVAQTATRNEAAERDGRAVAGRHGAPGGIEILRQVEDSSAGPGMQSPIRMKPGIIQMGQIEEHCVFLDRKAIETVTTGTDRDAKSFRRRSSKNRRHVGNIRRPDNGKRLAVTRRRIEDPRPFGENPAAAEAERAGDFRLEPGKVSRGLAAALRMGHVRLQGLSKIAALA
jgi:hypothetical protein